MKKEITDSQWATSFLASAYTEKQFRDFSEDMSDITRELVSKLEEVRKQERERIIERLETLKVVRPNIEPPKNKLSQNQIFIAGQMNMLMRLDDIIKNLNQ